MAQTAYVTRQEFDIVKAELERLSVAVQVLGDGQLTLTRSVADLAERVEVGFATVDEQFAELRREFASNQAEMKKLIEDGQSGLRSAILTLGKR